MADASLPITTEYVRCFLALMGKGFWWPDEVLRRLPEQGLDTLDVTYVLADGDVVTTEKETADGTTMVTIGYTCDEERIKVKFWTDPNQLTLRILDVARI